jgi:hypothetical protein
MKIIYFCKHDKTVSSSDKNVYDNDKMINQNYNKMYENDKYVSAT